MYLYQIDHLIYGPPQSLVSALRFVYGCGNARVLRADAALTPVVDHAGSSYAVDYLPRGRTIVRRRVRH